jgi:hypothetical protein
MSEERAKYWLTYSTVTAIAATEKTKRRNETTGPNA